MRSGFKKIIAAALAAVSVLMLGGCADSGYIMTVDGMSIRNGIYLNYQQLSYGSAYTKVSDELKEAGNTSAVPDLFKESVDGKPAADWIKEETIEKVKRFVAIQRLCERYGIELDSKKVSEINDKIKEMWDQENDMYLYIYGYSTIGAMYEDNGIGRESMKDIYMVEALSDLLFLYNYDKDGLTPVPEEDILDHVQKNYAVVKAIKLDYTDYAGKELTEDKDKQEVKDLAKEYADRLNKGGEDNTFVKIKYEVDLAAAQDAAQVQAEKTYNEKEDGDRDEYIKKAREEAKAEIADDAEKLNTYISLDSSSFSQDVTDKIWEAKEDGTAFVAEDEKAVYVIVREAILDKKDWIEDNREVVLHAIKNDDYEALLKSAAVSYTVEYDSYFVDKKYAPEKMKGV